MSNISTRQTESQMALIPSAFGMPFGVPACGHATDVARIKGDMGLSVRTYVPGTSAWSPPLS